MYPTSARWDSALRTSGRVVTRCEVWRSGSPVLTDGVPTVLKLAAGGEVRVDESSDVQRALTASIGDSTLMPTDTESLLAPIDTDLRVWAGVQYTESDTELVPVFTGRLVTPRRPTLWSHELSLDARDYSYVLAKARFVTPRNIAKGQLVTDVIADLVTEVMSWVEVIDLTGFQNSTGALTFDRDRWDAIKQLATGIGAVAYFDCEGRFIIRPDAVIADVPDWTVDRGLPTSVLSDLAMSMSSERVYNAVTATSSDPDGPVVSATIYQKTGPFRWRDGFQQPRFYASPLLRTTAAAKAAATTILARSLALSQPLEPVAAPNWALDVGDTVAVHVPSAGGFDLALRIVAGFTLPLGPGAMPLTVRDIADATDIEGES